jgi:hypothetical protein
VIEGTKKKTETLELNKSLALSKTNGIKLNKSTFDKCLNLALK